MKREDFKIGQIYTHEQYIQLSILEMMESKAEHTDKADPKIGAVLVDRNGEVKLAIQLFQLLKK
jgi:ATP-dependent DNA helicase RecG